MTEYSDIPNPTEGTPVKEHAPLPDFLLPQELQTRYQHRITELADKTSEWDSTENSFKLTAAAPHLFVSPLRSGPIAKAGYDAYCDEHAIPQPPTLEVVGIGTETRNKFLQAMQVKDPNFDLDEWESDEVQEQFRTWIASSEDPLVAQAITDIKARVADLNLDPEAELKLIFVDDAGGDYGDVRNRVTPAILTAALGEQAYTYEYHLMFPRKYSDDRLWYDQIVEATFGKNLPFPQREFLCEAVRGGFDDLYQRSDILHDYHEELEGEQGNYNLQSIQRLRILGEILQRNAQDLNEIAYPGQKAENGFEPLFEKYGMNLLQLKDRLIDALKKAGIKAPQPHKS